tara:strand:+ start:10193 stop:10546 length:354 start_codon:yes stop_codon:yes gene_type:complete
MLKNESNSGKGERQTLRLPKGVNKKPLGCTLGGKKVFSVPRDNPSLEGKEPIRTLNVKQKKKAAKDIPSALLDTWYWMWKMGQTSDITQEGKRKLLSHFGTLDEAMKHFEKKSNEKD